MRFVLDVRLLALSALVHAACASHGPRHPRTDGTVPTATAPPRTKDATATSASDTGPRRVYYDLTAHLDEAERHSAGTVVDGGTLGSAKYDLGGYGADLVFAEIDGVTATVSRNRGWKVWLPWDAGARPLQLTLRARAFRAGRLKMTLNGHSLEAPPLDPARFSELKVSVPASAVRTGENLLVVSGPATGRSAVGPASFAIDWLHFGEPAYALGPPPNGSTALRNGEALRFTFVVPRGARLEGRTDATLLVEVQREAAPPERLAKVASQRNDTFTVPLDRYAGSLVRLSFASEDDGSLTQARITVPASANTTAPPKPRNVLVYLIDTLRADKLRPYNASTRVETPGLMGFVERAATMRRAQTQENWTKPSVATLLSGLFPWQHTAVDGDSVLPSSVRLLPERLRKVGFYTGAFIANGYVSDRFGFRKGLDTYRNYIREGLRTPAQYVAADVLQWLDKRPQDKPFFLYVHTIDPHVPYRPPPAFLAKYGDPGYRGIVDFRRDATLLENVKIGKLRLNERDKAHLAALYDGEISYHDVHFHAIMEALERRNLANDTLVVVTSDHGEEFWDHGSVGHGHSVWQELIHVPMFVRWPGVTTSSVAIDDTVGLVDVVPTVLEILGQEIPADVAGTSFANLLRGASRGEGPRVAVTGFMDAWRAVTVADLKLIQRGFDEGRMYDLAADPGETQDRAETRPLAVRYLRSKLGVALARSSVGPRDRARRHEAEKTTIDPKTEAQLRALGYVGQR